MEPCLESLNEQPALAWKLQSNVLGADPASRTSVRAAREVRNSPLVEQLLDGRDRRGRAYAKWNGSHWLLVVLADLGCTPGDVSLRPLMEETYACWLSLDHQKKAMHFLDGRMRRCASQEGNAIWSSLRLGLADDRTEELVSRLLKWQWPDGGWNCDRRPSVVVSSFMETLIPLRALARYAQESGDRAAGSAASRAAEVFLKRGLFRRQRDGEVMNPNFLRLCYPPYWHYNILFGLIVLSEAGFLADPRCTEALDLLEAKRLPDGGFPAETTYYHTRASSPTGFSAVSWGGTSRRRSNPFVSADALTVLHRAGRLKP